MKLKSDFVSHQLGDEHLLVPVGKAAKSFHGLVKSNSTAGFIVECLRTETCEEEIVDKTLAKYDVDREKASKDVRFIINQLQGIDALE